MYILPLTSLSVISLPSLSLQTRSSLHIFMLFLMKRSKCFWFMHDEAWTWVSTCTSTHNIKLSTFKSVEFTYNCHILNFIFYMKLFSIIPYIYWQCPIVTFLCSLTVLLWYICCCWCPIVTHFLCSLTVSSCDTFLCSLTVLFNCDSIFDVC